MKESTLLIQSAVASLLVLGMTAGAGSAFAAKGGIDRCAGIAKAGKNDCGTATASCAGTSKVDGDKNAWIAVPKGTCEKIVGGQLADAGAIAKHMKEMEMMKKK
ncbi:MAG TPA: DUF2282 domain-containing protein [Burkholderiales bacterium]